MRTAAILMAGGTARRFGTQKLLVPYRGVALVGHAFHAVAAVGLDRIIAVTGADREPVTREIERLAAGLGAAIDIVHAVDHHEGLAATLRTGVAALPPDIDAALIFLGDMPDVPPAIADALIHAIQAGADAAAPVYGGQRGHPVALSRRLFEAVAALRGDAGAGRILAGLGDRLSLIETDDPGVLRDIDRPEDLVR